MPQMNKGGKFIIGNSLIRDDLTVHLPTQAITEYDAGAARHTHPWSDPCGTCTKAHHRKHL